MYINPEWKGIAGVVKLPLDVLLQVIVEPTARRFVPQQGVHTLLARSRFVQHIYQHNTYYSGLFKQLNLRAADICSAADLRKLPFLGKREIRAHQDALKCRNIDKLVKYNTGGSSGEPLIFYMGMDRVSHDVAAKWRATRWWNVDIGDTEAVIWGSPIELGKQDCIKQLRDWLIRSHLIPAP